jgi:hypothetical protein
MMNNAGDKNTLLCNRFECLETLRYFAIYDQAICVLGLNGPLETFPLLNAFKFSNCLYYQIYFQYQ